ncbi:MAG: tRNA preQ1(34) S-adenosylmethionine ribosyltransferase-isomerase QueA [Gammaproteobacteria bacterium]|nr:tRNA preQ1(34) S-adenosylmethionine ribosyltransferase-isomerase QueA [Gammaproteobacteria bacterium]MYD02243.1 tRNA preQ1(34) S-adenosylmethionine ribosyltransferase-isomerase QueA [Gammaproteobacteria bacterium]MYI24707.1 tRNA preQ1(34) S-adenosylmethionine ribosyltransferase-isomerase QueA [Gammaproteobacteria bacterium]
MAAEEFSYHAPEELIAQRPLENRGASRLLHLPAGGEPRDLRFADLPRLLEPGDLLVVNDTAVIPARLFGARKSGGRVEMLLERFLDRNRALAQLRANRSPRAGQELIFEGGATARVAGREDAFFVLEFDRDLDEHLRRHGHVPLPPYIRRPDRSADRTDYQNVFARHAGAVAAPTAGLHFDDAMLGALTGHGVEIARITLHVGAGTFKPVTARQIQEGELHRERMQVSGGTCGKIEACRRRGGRVCAVGTTVTRALETAASDGEIKPFHGETRLFIMPGFEFRVVDMLVTNFHLPESSLLMLVCAFAGRQRVLDAYRHAVEQRYRLFSYGDAMLLEKSGRSA